MSSIIIEKPDKKKLDSLEIGSWSPWECEVKTFPWEYDEKEVCYIFEGKVKVKPGWSGSRSGSGMKKNWR